LCEPRIAVERIGRVARRMEGRGETGWVERFAAVARVSVERTILVESCNRLAR